MEKVQVLEKPSYKVLGFWNRNASMILTSVGASGVIITSLMTAKGTSKAIRLLDDAEESKGNTLTKSEKLKIAGPAYIPSILFGTATISCIFGANILNKRSQAALVSAYAMLDQSYKEYKNKIGELYNDDLNINIEEEIAKDKYKEASIGPENGKELFYDEFSKRYFISTIEDVQRAEYRINRDLVMRDYAYLNEFYEELGLPIIDSGYKLGWSIGQNMDMYWQSWIDFTHSKIIMDDEQECYVIRILQEPVIDFENYI